MASYTERFTAYFDRDVAQAAAKSIGNGAEMEFKIEDSSGKSIETFTFTKEGGRNQVKPGPAGNPQIVFTVTPDAAEQILSDPGQDVGSIGVGIAKLIVSADANKRVKLQLKAGFLTLFSKGYLGVVTAGGGQFASYLASRGLGGMGAIKAALQKLKKD